MPLRTSAKTTQAQGWETWHATSHPQKAESANRVERHQAQVGQQKTSWVVSIFVSAVCATTYFSQDHSSSRLGDVACNKSSAKSRICQSCRKTSGPSRPTKDQLGCKYLCICNMCHYLLVAQGGWRKLGRDKRLRKERRREGKKWGESRCRCGLFAASAKKLACPALWVRWQWVRKKAEEGVSSLG